MSTAIVLTAFGTTQIEALQAFIDIIKDVELAFSDCKLVLAFTSKTIRNIWSRRAKDLKFQKNYHQTPELFYNIKTPLAALAELQGDGYEKIIIQPLYIYHGSEFYDLQATVRALQSIQTLRAKNQPFPCLCLGRPLLGMNGDKYDYHHDLQRMTKALQSDLDLAAEQKKALIYMGHGNPLFASSIYAELEECIRKKAKIPVYIATVEGWPGIDSLEHRLQQAQLKQALLKPLLLTAGGHAQKDMAGSDTASWKSRLEAIGMGIEAILEGIGNLPPVRQIIVDNIRDAGREKGIDL